jgi:hypothetical protein
MPMELPEQNDAAEMAVVMGSPDPPPYGMRACEAPTLSGLCYFLTTRADFPFTKKLPPSPTAQLNSP